VKYNFIAGTEKRSRSRCERLRPVLCVIIIIIYCSLPPFGFGNWDLSLSPLLPVVNKRNYPLPENNTHAMQFVYWFYSQAAALTFAVWPERDFGRASASWRALLVFGASMHSKKKGTALIIRFSPFFHQVSTTASLFLSHPFSAGKCFLPFSKFISTLFSS